MENQKLSAFQANLPDGAFKLSFLKVRDALVELQEAMADEFNQTNVPLEINGAQDLQDAGNFTWELQKTALDMRVMANVIDEKLVKYRRAHANEPLTNEK